MNTKNKDQIYVGQGIKIRARFRDPETSVEVSPATVSIDLRRPDGTVLAGVVESTDRITFYGRAIVDQPGLWVCVIRSSDPGAAVGQITFQVVDRAI